MTVETHQETPSKHEPIELVLSRLLFIGAIIAAILLAAGIGAMLLGHSLVATRLITMGLLALMATADHTGAGGGLIFVRERDWRFALFCLVVLCALAVGIVLGHGHGG